MKYKCMCRRSLLFVRVCVCLCLCPCVCRRSLSEASVEARARWSVCVRSLVWRHELHSSSSTSSSSPAFCLADPIKRGPGARQMCHLQQQRSLGGGQKEAGEGRVTGWPLSSTIDTQALHGCRDLQHWLQWEHPPSANQKLEFYKGIKLNMQPWIKYITITYVIINGITTLELVMYWINTPNR